MLDGHYCFFSYQFKQFSKSIFYFNFYFLFLFFTFLCTNLFICLSRYLSFHSVCCILSYMRRTFLSLLLTHLQSFIYKISFENLIWNLSLRFDWLDNFCSLILFHFLSLYSIQLILLNNDNQQSTIWIINN